MISLPTPTAIEQETLTARPYAWPASVCDVYEEHTAETTMAMHSQVELVSLKWASSNRDFNIESERVDVMIEMEVLIYF